MRLVLLLSRYAHDAYLGARCKESLTDTVKAWKEYGPRYLPLPHPSPRNNIWLRKNPWFARNVLVDLKERVEAALGST